MHEQVLVRVCALLQAAIGSCILLLLVHKTVLTLCNLHCIMSFSIVRHFYDSLSVHYEEAYVFNYIILCVQCHRIQTGQCISTRSTLTSITLIHVCCETPISFIFICTVCWFCRHACHVHRLHPDANTVPILARLASLLTKLCASIARFNYSTLKQCFQGRRYLYCQQFMLTGRLTAEVSSWPAIAIYSVGAF